MTRSSQPVLDRLLAKVTKEESGCWLWNGALHEKGYGQIYVKRNGKGRAGRTHVVAFELLVGPTAGLQVLHTCDVRNCVNPAHLFLGTSADNSEDMVQKGRSCRGAQRPGAKLDDDAVKDIKSGRLRPSEFAALYDVSRQKISDIRAGRAWKHVSA